MKKIISLSILLLPAVALAATKTLADLITIIIGYMNQILGLMMGLATVFFVWYVIQYYIRPNENRKDAGLYVMYSLIGFFVLLTFWGLVNILQNTFGLQSQTPSTWQEFTNLFPGGGQRSPSTIQSGFNSPPTIQSGLQFRQTQSTGGQNTTNIFKPPLELE